MGSAVLGAHEIAVDSFCDSLAVHVQYEAIDVQSEFVRVTNKVLSLERVDNPAARGELEAADAEEPSASAAKG